MYCTSGCGRPSTATWDGSYVTLRHPTTGDWSIIIVTGAAAEYTFNLSGGLSSGTVHVWRTNSTNSFEKQTDITPSESSFSLSCQANSIYSLTTTTGQSKGHATIPAAASFPFPYYENYERYVAGETPRYHMDQKGTFEVVADSLGKHARQIVPQEGILWGANHSTDKPSTVFGDPAWTNYDLMADVFIDAGSVEICSRVGHVLTNRGYRLVLTKTGAWQLYIDSNRLSSGTIANFNGSAWHHLKLRCSGSTITAFIDENEVSSHANQTRSSGMASFASSYNANMFDNLVIGPIGVTAIPRFRESKAGLDPASLRLSAYKFIPISSDMPWLLQSPSPRCRLYRLDGKSVLSVSQSSAVQRQRFGTGVYIYSNKRGFR